METAIDYLKRIYDEQPDLFDALAIATIKRHIGIEPLTGGCNPDNCHGTVGCSKSTSHGACSCVGNVCTWVPDLG